MRKGLKNAFLESPLDTKGHPLLNLGGPFEGIYEFPTFFYASGFVAREYRLRIFASPDGIRWHPVGNAANIGEQTRTDGVTVLGSNAVSFAGTTNFKAYDVGRFVKGAGIPLYAYIAEVDEVAQELLLEVAPGVGADATASATGVTITLDGPPIADTSMFFHEPTQKWWATMTGGDNEHSYHSATIAWSSDLVTWTLLPYEQRPDTSAIAAIEGQAATWAGEWFTDLDGTIRLYLSVTASAGSGLENFKIYEVHALDDSLTTWSAPVLVFDPPGANASVIDAHVRYVEGAARPYKMLYASKVTKEYIEEADSVTAFGPFVPNARVDDWNGWGQNLEAPTYVEITDTHHRIYMDRYTNQGIFYSDSFDGGATWSAKKLTDPSAITGSKAIGFSHPTILLGRTLKVSQAVTAAMAVVARGSYQEPYAPQFSDVLNFQPNFPPASFNASRRVSIGLGVWLLGQDIYSNGDYHSFVLHSLGVDAAVFHIDGKGGPGWARFGKFQAATGFPDVEGNHFPYSLSLGASYSTVRGRHAKHWIFRDPYHADGSNDLRIYGYGQGVSSPGGGLTPRYEFLAALGAEFAWYSAGVLLARLATNGALEAEQSVRAKGGAISAEGVGAEMLYLGGAAVFQGYNRGTAAYVPAVVAGQNVILDPVETAVVRIANVDVVTVDTANGLVQKTGKMGCVGLPVFANNTDAATAGLLPGRFYRTGGDPDVVCVVH